MSTGDIITLSCPKCGKTVKVKSDAAGKKVRCPGQDCNTAFTVLRPATATTGMRVQLMTAVGVLFAVIAAVLTIRELKLEPGWIVSMVIVGVVVISEFLKGYLKAAAVALFALAGLATPVLFFVLDRRQDQREMAFYVGCALFFALSCYFVFRTRAVWSQFEPGNESKRAVNLESIVVWFSLIVSSIAFAWVTYYKYLTPLGAEEFIVRRLVFTLFFVVVGVICTVAGRNTAVPFLAAAGLTYMAAGVLKALAYDISHTSGMIRIGVFASCGAVLLLGGFLMTRKSPGSRGQTGGEFTAVIED